MNKNLKLVILIVVLASAVFGGYFAWGFLKKPKNQNNQQNGKISDLKTYRNEKFGFEIKYPKDFKINEDNDNGFIEFLTGEYYGVDMGEQAISYSVSITDINFLDDDIESYDDYVRFSEDMNYKKLPDEKIGDYNFQKYEFGGMAVSFSYITRVNNNIYDFKMPDAADENILKEMIKSFKIIKNSASDLKTYRNEKFGFEFKYPKEIVISSGDTEEGDLYFEFCNDVSCFMEPDFFEIKNTEITDIDQLTKNFYYSDYCGEFNEKGEPIPGSGLEKDRKIINSLDGKKGVLFYSSEYENDGCTIIQFLNEKKIFSFIIANWKEQKFDEVILSSFKFIKKSASDLKTYRNEKYGFEFQYPEKKLNLFEFSQNTKINKFKNRVLDLGYPGPYGGFVEINVYNTNFQFIDSIMEDEKGRFSNIISSKDSNFDNKPGKIFTSKIINYNGEGYEDVFYKTILIQYADDKVISILGPSYTEANKEQDILFGEIVSTLKFIN